MANSSHSKPTRQMEYEKKQHKEEMKQQVITFVLMILFTFVAFGMVIMEVNSYFVIPTLIILAIVQVAFQLYYFMHMKNKGHNMPALMMYGGAAVAGLTIITFSSIIWW
ncbi:cytochrome c oxidase subunit IVB [Halobacillus halophilus]|uniref:Cytochrome c oxidase subunit IV n=1 Tax=Halobacillus halophilus (strain ATCC 35676 / DSM 2266 / JCM 20832 / KCTC 3685 / LMG 17431 / NBRC 102448 / NCIMB 2269) TaxID=866895 RepID=I0JM16_HALH3|nr:cytochrome c oxidase subunit IVB [Halobacillus halophilus]ASF39282.1 cytochrome c oxidase subunit IVB [Halobacillus halophilus]MCA1012545.1 cytochrome c oxidase subunit IVB [Halobacillus halophilus]CCG45186.1 cytochrome c oxidase subunit IV [Halobacillus halophilus DSM 2266]